MSPNVLLRPIVEDDVSWLRRFHTDPDALGEHEWAGFRDPGWFARRIEEDGFLADDRGWLVVVTDRDEPAGIVTWSQQRRSDAPGSWFYNVGIALLPEHRGCGVGTEAQRLLARYLFDTTPVARLEAGTHIDNHAEQRALEAVGFQREGVLRSVAFHGGEWADAVLYSLLRADLESD